MRLALVRIGELIRVTNRHLYGFNQACAVKQDAAPVRSWSPGRALRRCGDAEVPDQYSNIYNDCFFDWINGLLSITACLSYIRTCINRMG